MNTAEFADVRPASSSQQACLPAVGDVLAIVGGSGDRAAYVASRLAARDGGSVTGCSVASAFLGGRSFRNDSSVMALLESSPTVQRHDDLRGGGDGDAFVRLAQTAGVRTPQWAVVGNDVGHDLARLSAWHDLVVVQRPADPDARPLDGLKQLLLDTRLPCLVLPTVCAPCGVFDKVVLAWDGSGPAARAIRSALPLIVAAHDVVLLDGAAARADEAPTFEPVSFLTRHGVEVTRRRIQAAPSGAGAALLKKVHQSKADLLVMGAYGHAPMREWLLGGATRHVLAHGTVATWLSR